MFRTIVDVWLLRIDVGQAADWCLVASERVLREPATFRLVAIAVAVGGSLWWLTGLRNPAEDLRLELVLELIHTEAGSLSDTLQCMPDNARGSAVEDQQRGPNAEFTFK